jgi:LacI family transcriptional regulator
MKNPVRSTRELAEALGLSRWTVSRALNGHKGIHVRTVERVREAARTHGFSPSVLGRGLRSGRTDLIGVCVPDLVDFYLTEKIMRLQKAAAGRGLDVLLQFSDGSESSEHAALERFVAMACRGVVVVASVLEEQAPGWARLEAAGIRAVRIDPLVRGAGAEVSTDRAAGLRQVVEHLHELGHRSLVAVGIGPVTGAYGRQRVEGLRRGVRTCGWNGKWDLTFVPVPEVDGSWTAMEGADVVRPTAMVAVNDRVALRVIRWLDARGWKVPGDVSVVGFDNSEVAAIARPSLTTVDPHPSALMDEAVRLLFEEEPEPVRVRATLVVRESTGPVDRQSGKTKTRKYVRGSGCKKGNHV